MLPPLALTEAAQADANIRALNLTAAEAFAADQHSPRLVLMAKQPGALAEVLATLADWPLRGLDSLGAKAWQLFLTSPLDDAQREQLAAKKLEAEQLGFDLNYLAQGPAHWLQGNGLACFDMDSTLIQVEVIDELAKAHGVGEQVSAVTEAAMRGELDFIQSFSQRMAKLKGLEETVLAEIAASLPVSEGMPELIAGLQALGYKTAILSGGFDYFARHLQKLYGFDHVFANTLHIVDGKLTGEVHGRVVDGARKAELLQQLAAQYELDLDRTIAVGDGANDLPMLGLAGLGVAFRAKPIVRAQASFSVTELGLDGVLYILGQSK
ncbi:MAG: phosphoserine phosphatase SerB [Cellvibrionaceae bacterium]|nr:phosphoserine phosphatase SerB [Cellvibrionaceae bacterium]MCV6625386.1 phosphoserine phosphatase SerB [Cellvibrionaceae bacterium]